MRFYTNVQMVGDHFLVRGYENGQHFMTREKFYPTLFVEAKGKPNTKPLKVIMFNLLNLELFVSVVNSLKDMMA